MKVRAIGDGSEVGLDGPEVILDGPQVDLDEVEEELVHGGSLGGGPLL